MGSYFIFYDIINNSLDFEYDEITRKTYAKVRMSLYRVNDSTPMTTKIAEKIENIDINIIKRKDYIKKIKMEAEDDNSAILLFYLTDGDLYG